MHDPTDEERSHSAAMLRGFVVVLVGGAVVLRLLIWLFDLGSSAATALFAALPMLAVSHAIMGSERG